MIFFTLFTGSEKQKSLREALFEFLSENESQLTGFALSLKEDLLEISKRVIPMTIAEEKLVGLVGKEFIKGAFVIDETGEKIYMNEYPAYYHYIKSHFNRWLTTPITTPN